MREDGSRVLFVSSADAALWHEVPAIASALGSRYRAAIALCKGEEPLGFDHLRALDALGSRVELHLIEPPQAEQLSRLASRHDVIVADRETPALPEALGRLALVPPLVDWPHAPTALPIGAFQSGDLVGRRWHHLLQAALSRQEPAPLPSVFRSFWQGGFECSTHRRRDGRRLDVIAGTGHDRWAEADYRQLLSFGMGTLRDGVRWHLIEPSPGRFDFSSLTPMRDAAARSGVQVIWDLLHYGWPDDIDIFSAEFVHRFARLAGEVGRHMREGSDAIPFWCPVNEISFMSWGGGDVGYLNPFAQDRGFELKVQLARASIAAMEVLLQIDPRARFVHCEPAIAIHPNPEAGISVAEAEGFSDAQFQAFDMIAGRLVPEIGGDPRLLDICGVNYYCRNQWILGGPTLPRDDSRYRPLSDILHQLYARYGRPVAITETGIEAEERPDWFAYVVDETMRARSRGVPVEGICLYPVVNHLGWDDDRLCPNGMLGHIASASGRVVHQPLARALRLAQARCFPDAASATFGA